MRLIPVRIALASALLAGYRWVAHGWHPVGNGWRMEPGYWVRG
jgi:hypothetical protein